MGELQPRESNIQSPGEGWHPMGVSHEEQGQRVDMEERQSLSFMG